MSKINVVGFIIIVMTLSLCAFWPQSLIHYPVIGMPICIILFWGAVWLLSYLPIPKESKPKSKLKSEGEVRARLQGLEDRIKGRMLELTALPEDIDPHQYVDCLREAEKLNESDRMEIIILKWVLENEETTI